MKTAEGHFPESRPTSHREGGHCINPKDLAWVILPFTLAVILVIRAGCVDPGISLTTTPVSLLVALVGVAVAVAVPYVEASKSLRLGGKVVAIATSLLLALASLIWPWPFSHDNVAVYLGSGQEAAIGVHESLPGWMVNPYDPFLGRV